MNRTRVISVAKRHYFSALHSPPLLFDLFIWPLLDLLIWGLLTVFIQKTDTSLPLPVGFLLGGVLLWDLLFRSNQGMALAFLDDSAWSRSLLHMLVAPLRATEYLAGAMLWAVAKLAIGWSVMALGAWLLFGFSVLKIGSVLALFALAVMVFGVALSLVVLGFVLRYGNTAEILVWGVAEIISPLCAVYYPVAVLPGWARTLAVWLPPSHVFEGMRAVLADAPVPWGSLGVAFALDAVYLAAAAAFCSAMLTTFRRRGFVTRYM